MVTPESRHRLQIGPAIGRGVFVVEVLNTQRGHLAPSQAGVSKEPNYFSVALDPRRQSDDLLMAEVAPVGVLALGESHSVARIASNAVVFDSGSKRLAKNVECILVQRTP